MGWDRRDGAKPSNGFWTKRHRQLESELPRASTPMRTLLVLFTLLFVVPFAEAQTQLRFVTWRSEATGFWQQVIADFERRHTGVKVVQEVGPHSSTEFHDLVTQKLRNRDPEMDVFFMDVTWPAEFA